MKLYFLDDGEKVVAPARFDLEYWTGQAWAAVPQQTRRPEQPTGHRANVVRFPTLNAQKLRIVFTHASGGRTGLTELEAWGELKGTFEVAPPPPGNLALNMSGKGFPKASASFHDVFGGVPRHQRRQDRLSPDADEPLDFLRLAQRDRLAGSGFRCAAGIRPGRVVHL